MNKTFYNPDRVRNPVRVKSKIFRILLIITAGILIAFFIFRNAILSNYLEEKKSTFEKLYACRVFIDEASFSGLSGIHIKKLALMPPEGDSLLELEKVYLKIRLLPLFGGKIHLKEINIEKASVSLVWQDSVRNNCSFLFKKEKTYAAADSAGLQQVLGNLLNRIFGSIPPVIHLPDMRINFISPAYRLNTRLDLRMRSQKFEARMHISENDTLSSWDAQGRISGNNRQLDVKIFQPGKKSWVPFLKHRFNLNAGADTFYLSLKNKGEDLSRTELNISAGAGNLILNHWRLAAKDVKIQQAKAALNIKTEGNTLSIDSSSTVWINKITLHPYVHYKHDTPKEIALALTLPQCPAEDFFSSLPQGLFDHVRVLKARGYLSYRMRFYVNEEMSDSLQFYSGLKEKDFSLVGAESFSRIRGDFIHTVYEKGNVVKTQTLSPGSPDFTSLAEISPFLKAAVMISEDGNFYYHKGFNPEMFRRAIATNLKERRFVRGGSTISMQLVKNVFLSRDKTISRKMEEALIVWLIENKRLISKERMYEVYLNIIEWGPGVYGITRASEYYFKKKPNDLTLEESIFLAMIVPFPKWFKYQFDENGNLLSHTGAYYQLLAGHLVKKGVITEEQKEKLKAEVKLTGPARELLKTKMKGDQMPSSPDE